MLIDSFLFFNETELVELRVQYLEKIENRMDIYDFRE